MNNLAYFLFKLNKLKEAEVLSRETLKFRKNNLLPNHPDIGYSMNNLAGVL
jgi:tetratricopeptide (TPR) repeat protein